MDNYIVSARKYRPMSFDAVVGQSALTATLMKSIQTGHLAHAYLFCGPRGVGKTTCARIFAKTINCLSPQANGEACGQCESCVAFGEQRSLNIYELDAASNNGVEEIKKLIEQTRIPPQVGKYKVFIIDEVHMLSNAAFNAFLKTLEEPPQYVIFILATTEKHKLLPTILSRCQIYDFNRMSVQDMVAHLQTVAAGEGITAEATALTVIAEKADGGMRDALSIFDQVAAYCGGNITYKQTIENLNVLDYDYYFKLVDYILDRKIPDILATFNDIVNKGFEASHFISGLNSHFRALLMCRDQKTVKLLDTDDDVRQRYYQQSQKCKPQFIYAAIRKCTDCDISYKQSQNKRLLVEITLIEIAQLTQEDAPSSGRGPKKILKPIFTDSEAVKTTVAAQPATVRTESVQTHSVQSATTPQPAAAPSAPASHAAGVSGFSIRNYAVSLAKGQSTDASTQVVSEVQVVGKGVLDFLPLRTALRSYAMTLPTERSAMKTRLDNAEPVIINEDSFQLQVGNPAVREQLKPLLPELSRYVAQALNMKAVNIEIYVPEAELKPVLTPAQLYSQLKEKYPLLINLEQEMKLRL